MTARSKKAAHPKDNAKGRRKKENKELSDLASQLPLPANVATQLDKASVIRLATSYLKLRRLFPHGLGRQWGEDSSVAEDMLSEMGKFLNKAFHGFVFVLGADATILYISEEASAQLGFSQVQLTGKCFWSCIHSHDAKELKTILCFDRDVPAFNVGSPAADDVEVPRSFSARMKCILPKRQAELAVDRYKVIHCRGYLKLKQKAKHWDGLSSVCYEMTGVVASGYSLSPTPSAEIKLYRRDFMFRTGLNLQISYVDPRSQKISGYEPTQLQDKSLYKFIHPYDCRQMKQVHEMVLTKSQAVSSYYRFLTRNGGWIWIQSSCIVITSNKTDHGQCILFINSVLSLVSWGTLQQSLSSIIVRRAISHINFLPRPYHIFNARSEREYPNCILAIEQVATHESKQCNPTKRLRTSLKSRKRTPSHILQDSSPNEQNSMNASSNETPDSQSLIDMPLLGSNSDHHICGFIQKSHFYKSQQTTNSLEFNNDKYAPLSGLIDASGLNGHASPPYLEPINNAINFRHGINAEFHAMQNTCPELDDSGIAFQNPIMESGPLPSMFNVNSKNEQVTYYTTLMSVENSESENYKYLNPCVSATSHEDNVIFKPSHCNLTSSLLAFTKFSNPQKSNLDFMIHDGNSDTKSHVSDSVFVSDKSSLSTIERDDKFAVNSCNSSSPKNNKIGCINELDITTADRIKKINISLNANQHTHSTDGKNSCKDSHMPETLERNEASYHENCKTPKLFADSLPEKMHSNFSTTAYNFCNSQSNQAFSGFTMNGNKYTSQFDLFSNSSNGVISSKKMSDEENNVLLTACADVTKHDYDPCFNNKTTSDNEWTSVVIPTVDQSIIRNDDDNNIFYVLNDLNSGTFSYANYTTTEISTFPATMEDDNIMSHINNMPSPVETTSPTITVCDCNNIDTNPQVLHQSSGISSSIINIDHSGISSTSHNLNNSSISNAVWTTTKDSAHEDTTIGSEYLSLLNEQWTAMYSQSATNARSDSASSVSLGYGSESSYLGQSSPFSTYGESSFL